MGNWKDLGEVPDSEDESFDSTQSQLGGDADLENGNGGLPGEAPTAPDVDDIWGIPSSPPSPNHRFLTREADATISLPDVTFTPASSPLSPVPTEVDYDGDTGAVSSSLGQTVAGRSLLGPVSEPPPKPLSSPVEERLSSVILDASSPVQRTSDRTTTLVESPPSRGSPTKAGTQVPPRGGSVEDTDLELARAIGQAERSLRPRKPIQQHPYLLENAQYSNFMKSHGVKPLRVAVEPVVSQPSVEEDSQDRDFDTGGSQELTADDPAGDTGESQLLLFDEATDDRDILCLSPSPTRSSPPRAHLHTSSQQANGDQTDDTSIVDDDFPSLDDLAARKTIKTPAKGLKRYRSSKLLSSRKKPRPLTSSPPLPSPLRSLIRPDLWATPSVSPEPREIPEQSQNLGSISRSLSPRPARNSPRTRIPDRVPSPEMANPPSVVDLTAQDEGDGSSDSEASSSSSGSGSGSDIVVQRNGRRLRGVLPASYLRIAQQSGRDVTRPKRRSPERSPDHGPRRGVAISKPSTSKPSPSTPFFFNDSDDNDDDNETGTKPAEKNTANGRNSTLDLLFDDDGDSSAMEDNHVDTMAFRNKRSGTSSSGLPKPKRRKATQQAGSEDPRYQKMRQPKITQAFDRSKGHSTLDNPARRPKEPSSKKRRPTKTPKPPLLSILDVVEPKAPQFIRIAARTARGKTNLGKASPSRKHIDLGTRKDNVDARSVLHDWRSGKIRARISVPTPKTVDQAVRQPLGELSNNAQTPVKTAPRSPYPVPPNLTKRPLSLGQATAEASRSQARPPPTRRPAPTLLPSARPAQLEVAEHQRPEAAGFVEKKRALDALYRNARKTRTLSAASRLDPTPEDNQPLSVIRRQEREPPVQASSSPRAHEKNDNKKSRFRKRAAPKHVDIEAPHITHANDPLPEDNFVIQEVEEPRSEDKLTGLGPYGTHYTQHFEVFPLDHGVFFHETTLIGRGIINKIMEPAYLDKVRQVRPRASFVMDGQTLRWGPWDDTASSELGILVDWILERFPSTTTLEGLTGPSRPVEGSEFVLHYVVESLSFANDEAARSVIARIVEVFQSLLTRIEELPSTTFARSETISTAYIDVLTRAVVTILAVYRLNQGAGSNFSVSIQVEALLTRAAKQCVKMLLDRGLEDLRVLYGELQQLNNREGGIRSGQTIANSWVVLIRVLESACIARSSFWDVAQSAMMKPDVMSGTEANKFDLLWRDMFTLLPLCEFDNAGILTVGMRHLVPIEGWALPQQMLKRVFQLYTNNPRQGPNFNEYCRALAARCHYLVQQWGWRKCNGILGTMFDFFGSQNLGHLRNEEVYKSPRFLENLAQNPSLSIDPEDRCFHIFIKTLGLVILRLKKLGLTKDIKNLIARTLPNHSRQLLKENTVRQQDLAALRNHHDLLCTLFWAAPPALRPGIHLIEKLVPPGTSHKEACLINLRAWSQLARFMVSSDEGSAAFRPFTSWQTSIFQQLLDQYHSVASDIKQQFLQLSKDNTGFSAEMADRMIKKNRAAAMDILTLSAMGSYDALKAAGYLAGGTSTLNTTQLQQIFTQLDFSTPGFDWTILLTALETLDVYITQINKVADAQYSSDSSDATDPQEEVEDAVLLLDHKVAEQFFFMARTLFELPDSGFLPNPSLQTRCIEKTVIVAAKMASRSINCGLTRAAHYFTSRKYGLFKTLPEALGSPQKTYLPLFLANLVKNNVFDFKDVGPSLLGLWLLTVVKPSRSLAFENYFAETLKQKDIPYLRQITIPGGVSPEYSSNKDFVAEGLSYMRKDLCDTHPARQKQRRHDHGKSLQLIMQVMKLELMALKSERDEHKKYMEFVREIIALIKALGVGICAVDSFFTTPSSDYSPPMQDPKLHTAGIVAYGIRLGEGEVTAAPQLFHYLYNNFKIALDNDKIDEEGSIVALAMENPHVLSFMLGRIFPAVIWATAKSNRAWPLLEVYVDALCKYVRKSVVLTTIPEEGMGDVVQILKLIMAWFKALQEENPSFLSVPQLHIIVRLTEIANLFYPSFMAHHCCFPPKNILGLANTMYSWTKVAQGAIEHIDAVLHVADQNAEVLHHMECRFLFDGVARLDVGLVFQSGRELHPQVDSFANTILADVNNTWVVTPTTISWIGLGKGIAMPPTLPGSGTKYQFPGEILMVEHLRYQLRMWTEGRGSARDQKKNNAWGGDMIF